MKHWSVLCTVKTRAACDERAAFNERAAYGLAKGIQKGRLFIRERFASPQIGFLHHSICINILSLCTVATLIVGSGIVGLGYVDSGIVGAGSQES
jgi:hypothetical protein